MNYLAISFYQFFFIDDLQKTLQYLQKTWSSMGIKGRVYLSNEGINAQISLEKAEYKSFLVWKKKSLFKEAALKVQDTSTHAFAKLTLKIRNQLCAFSAEVDFSQTSPHLSPKEWKQRLDKQDSNTLVLDVRNSYESKVGHFSNAVLPCVDTFREFPAYADTLEKMVDKKNTTLLMYCTGGIRCEYYSAYLKKRGFSSIYQLQGGVIAYANEIGAAHWKGKLFVFDDRITVSLGSEEVLSTCVHCSQPADTYYNCANMDCNRLFTCCRNCACCNKGLCSKNCANGRVRLFDPRENPKPFRKLSASLKDVESALHSTQS